MAQTKEVETEQQFWVGYMSSTQFAKNYSWWNDFHWVPGGFGVVRTGLTRHFSKGSATAGLARLWLPTPASSVLNRREWRPWAQVQFILPIDNKHSITNRIRYDARFKQELRNGELVDNTYAFNHRVRFLLSFRRNLRTATHGWMPFVSLNNEVLLNFGQTVTFNTFDQNRVSLMLGIQQKNLQFQAGYMNRFVQTGERQYIQNHTLVVWITHRFNVQQLLQHHNHEMDGE